MGLKFKRQKPIGLYIVDFVCVEYGLIIERDGGQHAEQTEYDEARTANLNQSGFTVPRFWNHEVLQQMSEVLERIRMFVIEQSSPPAPLPHAGEGSNLSDYP